MTVAAQMLAAGADQQKVTKEIFGERPRREDRSKPQQQSKPTPKPVEKVETPKPIEQPKPVEEPEVFEMAPNTEVDVDQELDAFIHESADNDPLTWEAPAEDNVINYRP
jgi:hypothetical protein